MFLVLKTMGRKMEIKIGYSHSTEGVDYVPLKNRPIIIQNGNEEITIFVNEEGIEIYSSDAILVKPLASNHISLQAGRRMKNER